MDYSMKYFLLSFLICRTMNRVSFYRYNFTLFCLTKLECN